MTQRHMDFRTLFAAGVLTLVLLVGMAAANPGSSEAGKKYRTVSLSRLLGAPTKTSEVGSTLFRHAWHEHFFSNETSTVLRLNRTSCKSFNLRGGVKTVFGEASTMFLGVVAEGSTSREFPIPLNSVTAFPKIKVKPRRDVLIKVVTGARSRPVDVFLNGSAKCFTRSGEA